MYVLRFIGNWDERAVCWQGAAVKPNTTALTFAAQVPLPHQKAVCSDLAAVTWSAGHGVQVCNEDT